MKQNNMKAKRKLKDNYIFFADITTMLTQEDIENLEHKFQEGLDKGVVMLAKGMSVTAIDKCGNVIRIK